MECLFVLYHILNKLSSVGFRFLSIGSLKDFCKSKTERKLMAID